MIERKFDDAAKMMIEIFRELKHYDDDYFQKNFIEISESIDISDMGLLIDFAKIGIGVACVIKRFVKKELERGKLIEIPTEIGIPKREVGFVYKKSAKHSKALDSFIQFYKTYQLED